MNEKKLTTGPPRAGWTNLFIFTFNEKKYLGYDNIFKEIKKYKIQVDLIRFNIFI